MEKNIWNTEFNEADKSMKHTFPNGLKVIWNRTTNFVYLLDAKDNTIEKIAASEFTTKTYFDYLTTVSNVKL